MGEHEVSEAESAKRMYCCLDQLFDRYCRSVVLLAGLIVDAKLWQRSTLADESFNFRVQFDFQFVKLIDNRDGWTTLEAARRPLAILSPVTSGRFKLESIRPRDEVGNLKLS